MKVCRVSNVKLVLSKLNVREFVSFKRTKTKREKKTNRNHWLSNRKWYDLYRISIIRSANKTRKKKQQHNIKRLYISLNNNDYHLKKSVVVISIISFFFLCWFMFSFRLRFVGYFVPILLLFWLFFNFIIPEQLCTLN